MPSYLVRGIAGDGMTVLSIHIDAINQEENQVVEEMDVVNAVRTFLMTVPGVAATPAQKTETITTQV